MVTKATWLLETPSILLLFLVYPTEKYIQSKLAKVSEMNVRVATIGVSVPSFPMTSEMKLGWSIERLKGLLALGMDITSNDSGRIV